MTTTLSAPYKPAFPWIPLGVGLASLAAVIGLQYSAIEEVKAPDPRQDLLARQQSISLASALGPLGFGNLASGWLWLELIQYYGHEDRRATGYGLAYPYLDAITNLDPYFFLAYRYAASVLAFTAGEPEAALAVLNKGTETITPEVNPRAYLLHLDQTGIHFLLLGDPEAGRAAYRAGADWYEAVPEHEGNGDQWRALGDRLTRSPLAPRVQFDVWEGLYRRTPDPDLRERILFELARLGTVRETETGELELIPPPVERPDEEEEIEDASL